jgi:hypothetical protein
MCEFCTFPTGVDPDSLNLDFAGFFTAQAIEQAVQQANANSTAEGDDDEGDDDADSDGT